MVLVIFISIDGSVSGCSNMILAQIVDSFLLRRFTACCWGSNDCS